MSLPPHGEARPGWMDPEPRDPYDPDNPYALLSEGCACCHPQDPQVMADMELLADLLLTDDEDFKDAA